MSKNLDQSKNVAKQKRVTKIALLLFLLLQIQATKSKAESFIFKPIGNNDFIIVEKAENKIGQIIGHKIIDTVWINDRVPEKIWEKCYLDKNAVFETKTLSYVYEKMYCYYYLIDSTTNVFYHSKKIDYKLIQVNKTGENFNWLILILVFLSICYGMLLTLSKKTLSAYFKKNPYGSYVDCLINQILFKDFWRTKISTILAIIQVLIFPAFIAMIFLSFVYIGKNDILPILTYELFFYIFSITVIIVFFSNVIFSIIRTNKVRKLINLG
jgi:hypothetical protein